MIAQPLFHISAELDQDFDLKYVYENPNDPLSKKIIDAFNMLKKEKEEEKDKVVVEKEQERWRVKSPDGKCYLVFRSSSGLDVYEDHSRHYTSTVLPTLASQNHNKDNELMLTLYEQVCSSWKALTDVRFKLLGLVPAVSVVAWGQLVSAEMLRKFPGAFAGVLIALIGFFVTTAIMIYDLRNDTLYDDLISRGRKIEEELDVDTGIFLGRRNPPNKWINHSIPVKIIYWASMIGWLAMALWFILILSTVIPIGGL